MSEQLTLANDQGEQIWESWHRQIVKLELEPGPPMGWGVELDCGHQLWICVWPSNYKLPCSECVREAYQTAKALRDEDKT